MQRILGTYVTNTEHARRHAARTLRSRTRKPKQKQRPEKVGNLDWLGVADRFGIVNHHVARTCLYTHAT